MIRPPPISTLFPYTTLFRSSSSVDAERIARLEDEVAGLQKEVADLRSEEHTFELQSRENLVCRLLLEKKKKITLTTFKYVYMIITITHSLYHYNSSSFTYYI